MIQHIAVGSNKLQDILAHKFGSKIAGARIISCIGYHAVSGSVAGGSCCGGSLNVAEPQKAPIVAKIAYVSPIGDISMIVSGCEPNRLAHRRIIPHWSVLQHQAYGRRVEAVGCHSAASRVMSAAAWSAAAASTTTASTTRGHGNRRTTSATTAVTARNYTLARSRTRAWGSPSAPSAKNILRLRIRHPSPSNGQGPAPDHKIAARLGIERLRANKAIPAEREVL